MSKSIKMSASRADKFRECQLSWAFKYYLCEEPTEKFEYAATIFGSIFHEIVEKTFGDDTDILLEWDTTKIREVACDYFIENYEKTIRESVENGTIIRYSGGQDFRKSTRLLTHAIHIGMGKLLTSGYFDEYENLICEKELEYDNELLRMVGKSDLTGIRSDGSYDVIDFKTGKHFSYDGIQKNRQVMYYSEMSYRDFNRLPDKFVFLKFDRDTTHMKKIEINDVDKNVHDYYFDDVAGLYRDIMLSVETGRFKKADPSQRCQACNWCRYKKRCRAFGGKIEKNDEIFSNLME